MDAKRLLRVALLLVVASTVVLTSCSKGGGTAVESPSGSQAEPTTEVSQPSGSEEEEAPTAAAPTATLQPKEMFPETLVIHPEAFDFEANPATNTYVYYVPMMVAETAEYLVTELKALGWTELGKPTVMGHLATLVLQQGSMRLNVSMQDNERTETTRVQMQVMK